MRSRALFAVLLVVGVCAALAWFALRNIDRPPPPRDAGRGAGASEEDRSGPGSESAFPDRLDAEPDIPGAAVLHGFVVRDGVPVVARVDLWFLFGLAPKDPAAQRAFQLDAYFRESDPAHPTRTATAAGDGAFRFGKLRDGTYRLLAVVEDGAWATGHAEVRGGGPAAEARLEIVGGSLTLRGRAQCADGRPYRGVIGLFVENPPRPSAGLAASFLTRTGAFGSITCFRDRDDSRRS